jgi:hypothetical protein
MEEALEMVPVDEVLSHVMASLLENEEAYDELAEL